LLIVGTRPEAIKMAPVILECRRAPAVEPIVCSTGQHREMLGPVLDYFGIAPDLHLDVMQPDQSLSSLTSRCLEGLDAAIAKVAPDCLVVQGDTTTVLAASLAAFYRRVPLVHVEAGLRTNNLQSPWPEEFNRRVAGLAASLHCAPTSRSVQNLLREGIDPRLVHLTGNTVIDALLWTVQQERAQGGRWQEKYAVLGARRMVLVTGHRRENFGPKFEAICRALVQLAEQFRDVAFVYPVHLNPNVREPVFRLLGHRANIHLVAPATYPEFVWLMDRSTLILTDSGGVQEEGPSLRKPVLVMRDTTERPEAIEAGAVELVGTSEASVVQAVSRLLTDPVEYSRRQIATNPYGDGKAGRRILNLMQDRAWTAASQDGTRRAA
jgi:UDP-N-acetylglucosamine 2-epimerase (non-hydrolysing)